MQADSYVDPLGFFKENILEIIRVDHIIDRLEFVCGRNNQENLFMV